MYRYVAFLDSVLEQIEEHVARFPPERGGALLGPVGQPLVTEFIFDPEARTSGVTFTPSRSLADRVRARESADQQIELKGILHSHPGNMSRPSQGDHHAYEDSLDGAPWLGRLVAPIVTVGTRLRRGHDVSLPSGTMSVYVAERRPDAPAGVVVEPAEPHVLRISRDLKSLASALNGTAEPPFITDIEGQAYVAGVVGCEGFDLQVLVGPAYPFTPPVVIAARHPEAKGYLTEPRLGLRWDGDDAPASQGLRLAWDLAAPDETRLLAALLTAGQARDAPHAAIAALAAGQAALSAGQAALAAAQAAVAAGQAALAAGQPDPETAPADPDAEHPTASPEEPGLAELAAEDSEPEAALAQPAAEEPEPAAEPAEPEASLVAVTVEEVGPGAEPAGRGAEPVPLAAGVPEPDARRTPDIEQRAAADGHDSPSSPGLLQRIMRALNPRHWRREAAGPAAVSGIEAIPDDDAAPVPVADLAAVQGTGQADD
jgi:proteasome lid subunit RPN8/RPN11